MLALGPTSERPKADATITCVCLWERFWLRRDCLFPPTVAQIVFSACWGCKAGDRTRQHPRSYRRAHQWKPLLQVANDHRETVDTMPAR